MNGNTISKTLALAWRWKVLAYALTGAVLFEMESLPGVEYDSVGLGGWLFWLSQFLGAFQSIGGSIVFSVNNGRAPWYYDWVVLTISIVLAFAVNIAVNWISDLMRKRKQQRVSV